VKKRIKTDPVSHDSQHRQKLASGVGVTARSKQVDLMRVKAPVEPSQRRSTRCRTASKARDAAEANEERRVCGALKCQEEASTEQNKQSTPEFHSGAARLITKGVMSISVTVRDWSEWLNSGEEVDVVAVHHAMVAVATNAKDGYLGDAETILMAEAVSLNAMFANLARLAHATQLVDQFDRYLRLAFKAQNQCRATLETLAMMKNPPVFAKQANITAGPQQVNNGVINPGVARAGISESAPNKLLEAHGDRLDDLAAGSAGKGDSTMEAVGAIDGTTHAGRERASFTQRLPRRRPTEVSGVRQTR
jgi:hypothetical protein